MGLKAAGADLAFIGGFLNGDRYVGAHMAANTEIAGNSYARVQMALSDWTALSDGYSNTADQVFPDPDPGAWPAIVEWGRYNAVTGGNLLDTFDIADTDAPQLGASVGFDAGTLGIRFGGRITPAGALKCCNEGLVSGPRYLTIHDGAVPSGANFIDQPVLIAVGGWTADTVNGPPKVRRLRNNAIVNFGAAVTDLDRPMSVALRDGSNGTGAAILWTSTFNPAAQDPELGDAISFAANALSITLPID